MVTCRIILHGNLPDLVGGRREIARRLPAPTTVKDAVEALGIPHVEIGSPTDLATLVGDGAIVHVHPATSRPLPEPRFLCDLHVGKLARLLRFCGLDTLWDRSWREPALARIAQREKRTVLSQHRALLKRRTVTSGLLVRSNSADDQLVEVLRRFRLATDLTSPGRCTACNGVLVATARRDVPVPIPPRTAAWLEDYWLCTDCGKLYWEGTHVARMRERVGRAVAATYRPEPRSACDRRDA